MTEGLHDVVVVGVDGAEQRLAKAGITDIAVLDGVDLSGSVFDEATHTWALPSCRARIIVTNQIRSGREDLAPYLGVAVHGVPNYFMVTGESSVADARLDYIAECLTLDAALAAAPASRCCTARSGRSTCAKPAGSAPTRRTGSGWSRRRRRRST